MPLALRQVPDYGASGSRGRAAVHQMASLPLSVSAGVQAACMEMEGCAGAVVLPLDICSPASQLHEAAVEADNAFSGEGVDYLVHNAGMLQVSSVFQVLTSVRLNHACWHPTDLQRCWGC